MSLDVRHFVNTLSADDFRKMCQSHHVNSWLDDNNTGSNKEVNEEESKWLDDLKPPPIEWSDDLIAKIRAKQNERPASLLTQQPTRTFSEILKTARVEAKPSTSVDQSLMQSSEDDNQQRKRVNNVKVISSGNKKQSVSHYLQLSDSSSKTRRKFIFENSIPSISSTKGAIVKFKDSLTKKKKLWQCKAQEAGYIAHTKVNAVSAHFNQELTKTKKLLNSYEINRNACNKQKDYIPTKTKKKVDLSKRKQNKSKQTFNKMLAFNNCINNSFYLQYFTTLISIYQKVVVYFHVIREEISGNWLYKCIFAYCILHFDLLMFTIWVYIIYKLMKLCYELCLFSDYANISENHNSLT